MKLSYKNISYGKKGIWNPWPKTSISKIEEKLFFINKVTMQMFGKLLGYLPVVFASFVVFK